MMRDVQIGRLPGDLAAPDRPRGLVIFAHGSGSSRFSPRNRYAAERLRKAGLATLLFDLLTEEESEDRRNVFDIPLLSTRVREAVAWAKGDRDCAALSIGLFGASTGAGAALMAAAMRPADVVAVVSRGGRPDLAGDALPRVRAPTLLIVGGHDLDVLELNEQARRRMTCAVELTVIPGASHLFEEPGTLELALDAAKRWFLQYLGAPED
jgi:dienelactone hydrolase